MKNKGKKEGGIKMIKKTTTGIQSLGNELKQKCFGCGKTVTLKYYGQEEWAGSCKDCGIHYNVSTLDEEEMENEEA